ncbi:V-type ATP synthase subunit A [Neobittarella massiliensis]|uniref:V-type ATP synthase subunit A n=1 Tax=Neobittarella massiliensis (ex Bilen et al. 2018) TaxID=2041842 RepID=UPI000CF6671F|nr:V-type ATP synthase subunit A [Neobittarella massiliensis]
MNTIFSINGPVVKVLNTKTFSMGEMVYVGKKRLMGEVISISDKETTIQVYEETSGLFPGEEVISTGSPISLTLGPGIISNIYDGVQRPLGDIEQISGAFIANGLEVSPLPVDKEWDVTVLVHEGDELVPGQIIATCPETSSIVHKIMVPPTLSGKAGKVAPSGKYTIRDTLLTLIDEKGQEHPIGLTQKWPIRTPRPSKSRLPISRPLITGQRILDTMFPIAKGGAAAVPGGFGTGKTMTQHQIAKWCDADLIIYIGCGERGNEMTQVLEEFGSLVDPKTGRPLTDRTVLIANTSNMPVAAREASIYTGITLAEYYRDMGYHVAIMADSTSRWAEALREISGRLEEMPAEEGFPAYLPSRIATFYERAGYMVNLNDTEGSITIIGAVSPQGGDLSEPVTQNTKRFVRCFWALDKSLAYARHYPAINWTTSYSEYLDDLRDWYNANLGERFLRYRARIVTLLQEEAQLLEIVKLIGADVLPDDQKLIIEIAKLIRTGFLQQNAFHKEDTYVPLEKQLEMMRCIWYLYKKALLVVNERHIPVTAIAKTGLFDKINKMKYDIENDRLDKFDALRQEIDQTLAAMD